MPHIPSNSQTERLATPFIRSETALPIYWLNSEWVVTEYGMESACRGSWYAIDAPRLGDVRGDRADWPAQLEDKGWTDPRLFLEAFIAALRIHNVKHSFDIEKEWSLANKAADELVAYEEVRRRRQMGPSGKIELMGIASLDELESGVATLIAQGVRAPEFPESCVRED